MSEGLVAPMILESVDLGWRSSEGDFGWLRAQPQCIGAEEISELFRWADSTRSSFGQYWFWVPLSADCRALIRVSPLSGGERGTASTVQALLVDERVLCGMADLSCLLAAFPDVPTSIGQPAAWDGAWAAHAEGNRLMHPTVAVRVALQQLLNPAGNGGPSLNLPIAERLPPTEQIRFALQVFSFIPSIYRANFQLAFATENAPPVSRPRYVVTFKEPGPEAVEVDLDTEVLMVLGGMPEGAAPPRLPNVPGNNVGVEGPRQWRALSQALAASLLALNGRDAFFQLSTRLSGASRKVRTDWASTVEAELAHVDPTKAYDILRPLIEDSALSEACGFAPAWAPRLLVSSSAVFGVQTDEEFSRHMPALIRWFPAHLAQRLRERWPLDAQPLIGVIVACRDVLHAATSATEALQGVAPALLAPGIEVARAELFGVAFEASLDPGMMSGEARTRGVELLLDCVALSNFLPATARAAEQAHARAMSEPDALKLVIGDLAAFDAARLSAFLRAFEPIESVGRRRRVQTLLAIGAEVADRIPDLQMQTLARQDMFLGLIKLASQLRRVPMKSKPF